MSVMLANFFNRASQCPFACFLNLLLSASFIYVLQIAYRQVDMSFNSYIWLLNLVSVIAILALVFHWNCEYHKVGNK
jgi:hypothetical protein